MKLQPLSRQALSDKRWRRYTDYRFAAGRHVSALVTSELAKAMRVLPIAFFEQAGGYVPVALHGLQPGQNLHVHPDGRWLAEYVPAVLRSHPFYVATDADGQKVLCFDLDSGLLGGGAEGVATEPFFDEDGQPAKVIAELINFMGEVGEQRAFAERACAVLQAHDLIQPWNITLQASVGERSLQGLFRVDEEKLNQLDGPALLELQQSGAMAMAYCQLLSMHHLPSLARLAEAHTQWRSEAQASKAPAAGLPTTAGGELDLEFLNQGGTLHFGN